MLLIRNVLVSFDKQLKCNGLKWEIKQTTIIVKYIDSIMFIEIQNTSKTKNYNIYIIASNDLNVTYENKNKEWFYYVIKYFNVLDQS